MTGLWVGTAFLTGAAFGVESMLVWFAVLVLAAARSFIPGPTMVAIAAAILAGVAVSQPADSASEITYESGPYAGRLEVVDGSYSTRIGQSFVGKSIGSGRGAICAYANTEPRVYLGDEIYVRGTITSRIDLPHLGRVASEARGCVGQLRVESIAVIQPGRGVRATLTRLRGRISTFMLHAHPGDAGALLSGLVTGDDGGLSEEANDAFVATGTTHITAISGANFAVIVMVVGALATGRMRRSLLFVTVVAVAIWSYAILVGLQPSAVRAAMLATGVLVGTWLGRAPDLLTLTVLLAALQVALRPGDVHSLAFQLSIAATIALILVFDGRADDDGWGRALVLSVVAAQLATIPVLADRLGAVSVVGLGANLIVSPLASISFPLALAGGAVGLVAEPIGVAILLPAQVLASLILFVVTTTFDRLPGVLVLGHMPAPALIVVTVVCWGGVLVMSRDAHRLHRHIVVCLRSWRQS